MTVQGKEHSGRDDRRNEKFHSAVRPSHYSQNSYKDRIPEKNGESGEKMLFKKTENQLTKLAEELFGSPVDTDKLLVAALMLLLLKEGADPKLILALGYIFM